MISVWTWDDAPLQLKKMVATEKDNVWSFVVTVDKTYLRLLAGSVVSRAVGKIFGTIMCLNQGDRSVYFVGDIRKSKNSEGIRGY